MCASCYLEVNSLVKITFLVHISGHALEIIQGFGVGGADTAHIFLYFHLMLLTWKARVDMAVNSWRVSEQDLVS